MYGYLIKYWKNKFKIVDDVGLFKLLLGVFVVLFSSVLLFLEGICIVHSDMIVLAIILALCIQYNKTIIIFNISNKRKDPMYVNGRTTWGRFCLFQLLKENFVAVLSSVVTVSMASVMLFVKPGISLMMCMVLLGEWAWFYLTYYRAIKYKYSDRGKYNVKKDLKITSGVWHSNMMYFFRMPLKVYAEFAFQIAVLLICIYCGLSVTVVNYLMLVFFIVDIELSGDKNMEQYNVTYGKYAVKTIAGVGKKDRYILSEEFRIFLKYLCIELIMVFYGGPVFIGFSVMQYVVSYRYYFGLEKVLKERKTFKNTIFRMCMFYYILLAMAPFLFEKEIYKIFENYKPVYGMIFLVLLSLIVRIVPMENIINVLGDSVDEE